MDDTDREKLSEEIRANFTLNLRPEDALPIETRVFEVQKERQRQPGDIQITKHLCHVRFGERAYHLRVHNDGSIND